MNSPCENTHRNTERPWRAMYWALIYPDARMLTGGSLGGTPECPECFPRASCSCAVPVTPDVCYRAACQVAQYQRACFQRCEEAGRLGRKCRLLLFSCPGVITQKGSTLGIFPHSSRWHCWWGRHEASSLHFLLLVKRKALKLNQALLFFTLEMLWSLNCGFNGS